MAKLLIYYAHPGANHSHVNKVMAQQASMLDGITFVDLYAEYPRHNIDIEKEQQRLRDHDVILFQFPLFWYSTPSIMKEWQDLVLEYGFAYGHGSKDLQDKIMMLVLTTGGPQEAYSKQGYQNHELPAFLTPLQQTATLCKMRYVSPYVLFGALKAPEEGRVGAHLAGYVQLVEAIRDDRYDFDAATKHDFILQDMIPALMVQNAGEAHS